MQNKFPKVSIILLNYNGYNDTIACFESLQEISYTNYNIIIVDNNSPDKSIDKINQYMINNKVNFTYYKTLEESKKNTSDKFLTLIQSGFNGGYGHGNNIGIKYALDNSTDYVLVLNNDTIVEKDFLEPLVQELIENKDIGIISSQIFFEDRRNTYWFNGGTFNNITGKIRHTDYNKNSSSNTSYSTFNTGCIWLIPKNVFNEVGFINEDYFMYIEDLEFSFRVQKYGYKLQVSKNSKIYHKVGSSSGGELTSFSTYWRTKNYLKFMVNNINFIYWPFHFVSNILIFSINIIRNNKSKLIKNQLLAVKDFIQKK